MKAPLPPPVIAPYLKILASQLATTLWPAEEGMARDIARYGQRMLKPLAVQLELLPTLRLAAFDKYALIVDSLVQVLKETEGSGPVVADLERSFRTVPDIMQSTAAIQKSVPLLLSLHATEAKQIIRQISAIELELHTALNAALLADEAAAAVEDTAEALSAEQLGCLARYLRETFPGEETLVIGAIKAIPGGFSKQTIFLYLDDTRHLPDKLVLRADRADSPVGSTVANEFSVIQAMHAAGVPVPEPFSLCDDRAVIGVSFMVLGRVEGKNIGDSMDIKEPSREAGRSLARALARMHRVSPQEVGTQLPGADIGVGDRMRRDIAEFEDKWRATGLPSVALETAMAWLKRNVGAATSRGRRCVIHRDVGCHNMLFRDGELAALLDWETCAIGTAAQDLGYAYPNAVQLLPWDEFLAEYVCAGGDMPTPFEVDYFRLWRTSWLMVLLMMSRHYVESGITRSIGYGHLAQYQYMRFEHELNELVAHVLARD